MSGSKSNFLELEVLDHVLGNAAYTAPATVYMALFTAVSADGGTFTEVPSTNAYARASITNNATNWPAAASGLKQNGAAITFAQATPAGWGTVRGWGLYDAATVGNLLYWGLLVASEVLFTADATTDMLSAPGHAIVDADPVVFTTIAGATLPTGVTAGVTYYARDIVASTSFKVAASAGGTAINLTASGGGIVGKDLSKAIAADDTASFAISAVSIVED
jgi:hypothetical protein